MQAPLIHLSLAQLALSQVGVAVGPERSRRKRHAPAFFSPPTATLPSLSVLVARNRNFEGMAVRVAEIEGKGLGLIATREIAAGTLVAKYLTKTYNKSSHAHSSYTVNRPGDPTRVNDIFAGSFPPPGADGIPFVAPFANEVSQGENAVYNAELRLLEDDIEQRRTTFGLFTTMHVLTGTELTWHYGASYRRSGYRALQPSAAQAP